jgi:hypothetical protein
VEDAKREGGNGKEVDRGDIRNMINNNSPLPPIVTMTSRDRLSLRSKRMGISRF